jgi:hypothetical protein
MIKHDHKNESFKQFLQRTNLNRISQITFHISRQDTHVTSILSQQTVSALVTASKFSSKRAYWFVLIATVNRLQNLIKSRKKKNCCERKVYNHHVLEKKQFINKTFIFIYYRLLFQKYEHDSIISWNQTTKSIHFTKFSLYSSRLYRCTSERFRARLWL